jgi:Na+/H+-dicarboxylate symporter
VELSFRRRFFNNYAPIIFLIGGILLGGLLGQFAPEVILRWKPVGDTFLVILLIAVFPLIFFTVSSGIANLESSIAISRLIIVMILVFTGTVLLASFFAIVAIRMFPISINYAGIGLASLKLTRPVASAVVAAPTVNGFPMVLAQNGVLPLIVISILAGVATRSSGKASDTFKAFLSSGNALMKGFLRFLMKFAPIGLGIYFACQLAASGSHLIGDYTHILITAHLIAIFYFLVAFSGYAIFAGGMSTAKQYWKNNVSPSITALATCSSIATIPANLDAAGKMGVPTKVGEVSIPLGAILHKEGSAIVTVVGLSLVGNGFSSLSSMILALLVAVLVSVIEGSIPNGGYTGQLLIMSVYHFPADVWPVIIIISTLLDPIATLLNVGGDTASALLISRLIRKSKPKIAETIGVP